MNARTSAILLALVVIFPTTISIAQEHNPQIWFMEHVKNAKSSNVPNNIFLEIETFEFNYTTQDDLNQLISSYDDTIPIKLQFAQQKIDDGGERVRYRIWYQDEQHWRLCRDTPYIGTELEYLDAASNGGSPQWIMTPSTLHITDNKTALASEQKLDPQQLKRLVFQYLFESRFAVSASPKTVYSSNSPASPDDDYSWMLRVGHSYEPVQHVDFYLDSDSVNDFVIRKTVVARDDYDTLLSAIGSTTEYRTWAYNDLVSAKLCDQFTIYDINKPFRTISIISLRPLMPNELEPLIAPPLAQETDLIRGTPTYNSILNHTENKEIILDITKNNPENLAGVFVNQLNEKTSNNKIGYMFLTSLLFLVSGILLHKRKAH